MSALAKNFVTRIWHARSVRGS